MTGQEHILLMHEASFRYVDEAELEEASARGSMSDADGRVYDMELALKPGWCTVLCGKSGHGKSTVLRMAEGLAGSYYPGKTTGTVQVLGVPVRELSNRDRTQAMGVVMQDPRSQFFMGTVADEIAFSLENLGFDPKEIVERVMDAARMCEVSELLDKSLTELSSGQKQRIALACAYAIRPRLVLMDEPTSNLDEPGARDLVDILARLKGAGCAILISEHRLHRFLPIADEFVCLRDGRIAARWSTEEFARLGPDDVSPFGLRHPLMATSGSAEVAQDVTHASQRGIWRLENLTYLYPSSKRGIRNLSVSFPEGTVTIVEGPNGAGKTTLARVLCGSLKQSAGTVSYDGKPQNRASRRRTSYFVMQDVDYQLYAPSVADEVVLGRKVDDALKARAWEALAAFDLTDIADRHPASLSGGQKQRVILAAAYCSDASLIVLDEPTSGLDGDGVRQVASWCKTLARQGKAVVVITHDAQLAQLINGSVLHMVPDGAVEGPMSRTLSSRTDKQR